MRLEAHRCGLVVVDLQARMLAAMHAHEAAANRARILVTGFRELDLSVWATRQVPDKLGDLDDSTADALGPAPVVDKTAFPVTGAAGLTDALSERGCDQVLLAGIETHVCVLQSALALQEAGYRPAVCADACSTRHPDSHSAALARLRSAGVSVVTSEMALFELLGDAAAEGFKAISKLVK